MVKIAHRCHRLRKSSQSKCLPRSLAGHSRLVGRTGPARNLLHYNTRLLHRQQRAASEILVRQRRGHHHHHCLNRCRRRKCPCRKCTKKHPRKRLSGREQSSSAETKSLLRSRRKTRRRSGFEILACDEFQNWPMQAQTKCYTYEVLTSSNASAIMCSWPFVAFLIAVCPLPSFTDPTWARLPCSLRTASVNTRHLPNWQPQS
jgi:hypothetical protein